MIQETSQVRLVTEQVNLRDIRDVKNMYHRSSEAINWNYLPHNMFVTNLQTKDVQSPIPWYLETVTCLGKKMY